MGALKNQMQHIREKKRSPPPSAPVPVSSTPQATKKQSPAAGPSSVGGMSVRGKALPHKKQAQKTPKLHVRPPVVEVSASEALEERKRKREADRRALRHFIQKQRGVSNEASSSPSMSDISRSPESMSPSTPQQHVAQKKAASKPQVAARGRRLNRLSADADSVSRASRDCDSVATESSVDRARRMREQRDAERAELRKLIAEQRRQHRAEKSPAAPESGSSCQQEAFAVHAEEEGAFCGDAGPSACLVMTAIMEEESNTTHDATYVEQVVETQTTTSAKEEENVAESSEERKVQFKDFLGQTYTPVNSEETAAASDTAPVPDSEPVDESINNHQDDVQPTLLDMESSVESIEDDCCGALYGFFKRDEKVHPKCSPTKTRVVDSCSSLLAVDENVSEHVESDDVQESVNDVGCDEVEPSIIYGEGDDNELMMSITLDETEYNQIVSVMQEAMESLTEVMDDEDEEFGDESTATEEIPDVEKEGEDSDESSDGFEEVEEDSIEEESPIEANVADRSSEPMHAPKQKLAAKPLVHYMKEETAIPPLPSHSNENYKELLSSLPMDAVGMVKELEGLLSPNCAEMQAVDISYADTIRNEARLPAAVRESMDNEDMNSVEDWSGDQWENEEDKNLTVYGIPMVLSDTIAIDEDDSPATKIEVIREYLEEKLGLGPFVKAYRFLKSIHEMHEDDEMLLAEMEDIVGADGLQYIDIFFQLLTIEDKFES